MCVTTPASGCQASASPLLASDGLSAGEVLGMIGVVIWTVALLWFVVSGVLRARHHHQHGHGHDWSHPHPR
jgi:hypothetical protein